jgi:MFS family permease
MMELSAPAALVAPAALDPRRWRALALLCGAFFMVLLDGTITIVALPSIGADLGFAKQDLPWVLSAYALTVGGLLLLGGRAGRNRPGAGPRAPRPAAIGAWPQPPMRLTGIESVEGGVAFLTYERARDAQR